MYQSGFGNDFATEAISGTLPAGQNSPQKVAHGLYAEQLSGTPFTAARAHNRRSWLYRIRPSVCHEPYAPYADARLRSDYSDTPPNQLRWDPFPVPSEPIDFVDGLITVCGNGDPLLHSGMAAHVYVATRSMEGRFFYDADGELLIVPQQGRLALRTELGALDVEPGEIAVIQRGIKFRVELPDRSFSTLPTPPPEAAGTATVDFVISPPRWMVAEHTFRPPYFHRNVMSEYMGLIEGVYDAKAEGFVPGGASLHNCMSGHGPDTPTFDQAAAAPLQPHFLGDTLAFMFETRFILRPTKLALDCAQLQRDYWKCWQGLSKHFSPG